VQKEHYSRPENIPADMSGDFDHLDARMKACIELMEEAPLVGIDNILDIGFGKGQLSVWLAKKGKAVTATGLEIDSYEADTERLINEFGIKIIECSIESMPIKDETFDAVVMSHVLEHCPNVWLALREVHRVLRNNGYLFIIVPEHTDLVCAGHISVGWNIGQLMYVLLLNGFNVKTGSFIEYKSNICAFVRKGNFCLPPLRFDRGDINLLNESALLPLPVIASDGFNDNFAGNVKSINWKQNKVDFYKTKYEKKHLPVRLLANAIRPLLPKRVRSILGNQFIRLGKMINCDNGRNPNLLQN